MNIGKMSAQLSASPAPFVSGINAATAAVTGWGSKVTSTVARVASEVGSKMSGIVKSLGMAGAIGGALGGLSAGGLFLAFKSGVDDLIKTDVEARKLGMSIGEMRAALAFAGPAADQFAAALGPLQEKLHALQMGEAGAKGDFLGLSALSGKDVARDWSGVVESIAAIQDPAQKAAMAVRFLGAAAYPLLAEMERGGQSGAGSRNLIERMGLGVSPAEIAMVRQVADSMRQMQALASGVFNQLVVGIAPFVAELSKVFNPSTINISWIKDGIGEVVRGVGLVGGFFVEAMKDSSLFWDALEVGIAKTRAALLALAAEMTQAMTPKVGAGNSIYAGFAGAITGLTGGGYAGIKKTVEGTLEGGFAHGLGGDMAERAAKMAAEAAKMQKDFNAKFAGTDSAKGVNSWIDGIKAKMDGLNKAMTTFPAEAITAKYVGMFKSMSDAISDPAEKFRQTARDLEQMAKLGLFAGDPSKRAMMGFGAFGALSSATGMGSLPQSAGATEAGTREAYSAILSFQKEGQRGTVQEQIKNMLEMANRQREMQIEVGRQTLDAMRGAREAMAEIDI
jgi:hypothetical protein